MLLYIFAFNSNKSALKRSIEGGQDGSEHKVCATKPKCLSWSSGTHRVEGENPSSRKLSSAVHVFYVNKCIKILNVILKCF